MPPRLFWQALEVVGFLVGVAGLVLAVAEFPLGIRVTFAAVALVGLLTLVAVAIFRRSDPPRKVRRQAMIDTGKRLIAGAKRTITMFGTDMSWAVDYEDAIRTATHAGKIVKVFHVESTAPKVIRNAAILRSAGAIVAPVSVDFGIRGMLVDGEDHRDSLLFLANRQLRKGASEVAEGLRGSEETHEYTAKIYGMDANWLFIRVVFNIQRMFERRG